MKKHIYLHTSNFNDIRDLREDRKFESVFEYPAHECSRSHRNEYGRIKTDDNFYHILVGQIPQEDCPWCGCFCKIEKVGESTMSSHSIFCMICTVCRARGPILSILKSLENDNLAIEEYQRMMKQRFESRRCWDDRFQNHYELGNT